MTIKQKQWQLYYLGYYGGEIDGIWGARSKAATVSFQKDNALDADGIFGDRTAAKSEEIIKAIHTYVDGIADLGSEYYLVCPLGEREKAQELNPGATIVEYDKSQMSLKDALKCLIVLVVILKGML